MSRAFSRGFSRDFKSIKHDPRQPGPLMSGVSPAGSPARAAGDGAACSIASSAPDKTLEANLVLASGNIYLFADHAKHSGISLATRIVSLVSGKK